MNWKLCFFILILVLDGVYADGGETFRLDFNLNERYDLWMDLGDRVLFEYGGNNHTIILDAIKNNNVEIDIFLFLEEGLNPPHYAYLTEEFDNRLDFDRDGNKELSLRLGGLDIENDKANIIIQRLEAWDKDKIIELGEGEASFDENVKPSSFPIYPVLGIVILIIILVGIVNRIRKDRDVYF
jgi:hypothetical protein